MPETPATEPLPRIFKIGSTTIHEDESLRGLSLDEVTRILAHQYPQVTNATRLERTEQGSLVISYTAKPGQKG